MQSSDTDSENDQHVQNSYRSESTQKMESLYCESAQLINNSSWVVNDIQCDHLVTVSILFKAIVLIRAAHLL